MLEGVVAALLDRYLGDYLVNLNRDNLHIAVWGGDVELDNLELRRDALAKLNLPVTVNRGFLGKLKLKVPWQHLGSEPVVVLIDQVFLLVGPKGSDEFDKEEEEERIQTHKQRCLHTAEVVKQSQRKVTEPDLGAHAAPTDSFTTRVITKVMDNLDITITNVHIRYEDDTSCPDRPFTCGITLEELSARSCDWKWIPKFIEETDVIRKLGRLKKLAIYWDPGVRPMTARAVPQRFHSLIARSGHPLPAHQYLLRPVTGTLKLETLKSDAPNMRIPKYHAKLEFGEIAGGLSDAQYLDVLYFLDVFSRTTRAQKYRKFHPKVSVRADRKAWWRYAGFSIVSDIHERAYRWSWKYLSNRRRQRLQYVRLYEAKLRESLVPTEETQLDDLETELSYEDILYFRSLAEITHKRNIASGKLEVSTPQTTAGSEGGWIAWMFGYGTSPSSSKPVSAPRTVEAEEKGRDRSHLSEEEKKELYRLIGYDESPTSLLMNVPKNYVKMKIDCSISTGSLSLIRNETVAFKFKFDGLKSHYLQRPFSSKVSASLEAISLSDFTTTNSHYPTLISQAPSSSDTKTPWLQIVFEQNPLDNHADSVLGLSMEPLDVIFCRPLFDEIRAMFAVPEELSLAGLGQVYEGQVDTLRKFSRAKLIHVVENHRTIDVRVAMKSPNIIIPEDVHEENGRVLVVDLGNLSVRSDVRPQDEKPSPSQEVLEAQAYDNYTVSLSSIQVILAPHFRVWRSTTGMVRQFDIILHAQSCVAPTHPTLTKVKLQGSLPCLDMKITSSEVKGILEIVHQAVMEPSPSHFTQQAPRVVHEADALPTGAFADALMQIPENTPIADKNLLEASFSVREISLLVCKEDDNIARVLVRQITGTHVSRALEAKSILTMESFVVENCAKDTEGAPTCLISSVVVDQELMKVVYLSTSRESSHYAGVDTMLDLQFGGLEAVAEKQSMLRVLSFLESASPTSASPGLESPPLPPPPPPPRRVSLGERILPVLATVQRGGGKIHEIISLKIVGSVSQLAVRLHDLADVSVSNATLDLRQQGNSLEVKATLGGLKVADKRAALPEYFTILDVRSDHVVDVAYRMRTSRLSTPAPAELDVRFGATRMVYIQAFLDSVVAYFVEIGEMRQVLAATATKAKNSTREALRTERTSNLRLRVFIGNPMVVLPRNAQSTKAVFTDLGETTITNSIAAQANGDDFMEVFHVESSNISFSMGDVRRGDLRQILRNASVNLQLQLPLSAQSSVRVSGTTSPLEVAFTSAQYNLFLTILSEAFMGDTGELGTSQQAMSVARPAPDMAALQMEVDLAIPQVTVQLLCEGVEGAAIRTPFAKAIATMLSVHYSRRPYDDQTTIALLRLDMEDERENPGSEFRKLATSLGGSNEGKELIKVGYMRIQRNSPDYVTKYFRVDEFITLDFNTLHIIGNRETWIEIIHFFTPPTVPLELRRGSSAAAASPPSPSLVPVRKISGQLNRLGLTLNAKRRNVAHIAVERAHASILQGSMVLKIVGTLGSLSVMDMSSPHTQYPQILETSGEEMVAFKYDSYEKEEAALHGCDAWLDLRMASVRVVYLQRFLDGLVNYITETQEVRSAVLNAATSVMQSAKSVLEGPEQYRFKFMVELVNPLVSLPRTSQSLEHLFADLGRIRVSNAFAQVEGVAVERYTATMDGMNVQLRHTEVSPTNAAKLIEDVNVGVVVERAAMWELDESRIKIPGLSVAIASSRVHILWTREDYNWVLAILTDTFAEAAFIRAEMDEQENDASPTLIMSAADAEQLPWLSLHASIDEICVSLRQHEAGAFMEISGQRFVMDMLGAETETSYRFRLHGLLVEDRDTNIASSYTESSDDLIRVEYRIIYPSDVQIQVAFSHLDLRANREAWLEAIFFFSGPSVVQPLAESVQVLDGRSPNGSWSTAITAEFGKFNIDLHNNGTDLAQLRVGGIRVALTTDPSKLEIKGKLESLALLHAGEGTRCSGKELLGIPGDELASFSYTVFTRGTPTFPGYDSFLHLRVNTIRITFMRRFLVDELLAYVWETQAMIMDRLVVPTTPASSDPNKLLFDILITRPHIIIPRSWTSTEVCVVNLGDIALTNRFESIDEGTEAQLISVAVTAMDVATEDAQRLESRHVIVEGMALQADLTSVLDATTVDLPLLTVFCHVGDIDVAIGSAQRELLEGILYTNITDTAPASESIPREPSSHASVASDMNTDQIGMTCEVCLSALRLTLLGEDLLKRFTFSIQNARLCYTARHCNGDTELTATVGELVLEDVRPTTRNVFRRLVAPHRGERITPSQLCAEYKWFAADGSAHGNAILHCCRIFYVPECVNELQRILSSSSSRPPPPVDNISPDEKMQSAAPSPLCFDVELIHPEVCLVADPSTKDTQAVVLRTLVHVSYQQGPGDVPYSLAVGGRDVEILMCHLGNEKETSTSILQPLQFDLNYAYKLPSTTDKAECHEVHLDINPTVFRFSYKDFITCYDIYRGSFLVSDEESTTQTDTDAQDSPQSQRSVSGMMSAAETKILLGGRTFEVTLINDLEGADTPLLDLRVDDMDFVITSWEQRTSVQGKVRFLADYFNPRCGAWEPFVEPWIGNVLIWISNKSPFLSITVDATDTLYINVSSAMKEALLAAYTCMQQDFRALRSSTLRPAYQPYQIWNQTGCEVEYWTGEEGQTHFPLPDGMLAPLSFPRNFSRSKISYEEKKLVSFTMGGEWDPIRNVSLDRTGRRVHVLRKEFVPHPHRVLTEVILKSGSKVLVLRSTILVKNVMTLAVDVQVQVPGASRVHIITIEPGEENCIPVLLAQDGYLRFRPSGFGCEWSSAEVWRRFSTSFLKEATCRLPEGRLFRLGLRVTHDEKLPTHTAQPRHIFAIFCPLFLQNQLPVPLVCKVSQLKTDIILNEVLEPGFILPMHVFDRSHKVVMRIQIAGFLWSETVTIFEPRDDDVDDRVGLNDMKDRELNLNIDYSQEDIGGIKVAVYAQYWLVNKTRQQLLFRAVSYSDEQLAAGQDERGVRPSRPPTSSSSASSSSREKDASLLLFSYNDRDFFGNRIQVSVNRSPWSKKAISLETVGSTGVLEVEGASLARAPPARHVLGVSFDLGEGIYEKTKIITFRPHIVLVNNTGQAVNLCQHGTGPFWKLQSGETLEFHWPDASQDPLLSISFPSGGWEWSGGFRLDEVGELHVKMRNRTTSEIYIARVEVKTNGSTNCVVIGPDQGVPPFRIVNNTPITILFCQKGLEKLAHRLRPHTSVPYAWDVPAIARRLVLQVEGTNITREFNIMKMKRFKPLHVKKGGDSYSLVLDVTPEGPTRVCTLRSADDLATSMYLERGREPDIEVEVRGTLHGIGVSLVNTVPEEIAFCKIGGIHFDYTATDRDLEVELRIQDFQVDNTLLATPYPVALYNTVPDSPFMHIAAIKNRTIPSVDFFSYFSLLVTDVQAQVDQAFLDKLILFGTQMGSSSETDSPCQTVPSEGELPLVFQPPPNKIYFDLLILQPLKVNLSFAATTHTESETPIHALLSAVGIAVTNIEDANVTINALVLKNVFDSRDGLLDRIKRHVYRQLLRQAYNIVGSIEMLGNPDSLFRNVSTGVLDFFYEPVLGIRKSPGEIVVGLRKGTKSLVKNSVHGLSNAAAKITASLARGVAQISLDKRYIERQRTERQRVKAKHVVDGVGLGARALLKGVAEGVTGIVSAPLRGLREDGAGGFVKGVVKGIVGVAVKPAVGVMDLVSRTGEGVRALANLGPSRERIRAPRFFGGEGILQVYDPESAEAQKCLHEIRNGKYASDRFVFRQRINLNTVFLCSNERVLLVIDAKEAWTVPFKKMSRVVEMPNGVSVKLRDNEEGLTLLSGLKSSEDRFIRIPSPHERETLIGRTMEALREWHAR